MKDTKIEWADHTFNPWWGCQEVSPACDNCYAKALDKRTGGDHWGAGKPRRRTSATNWKQPIKWNRDAEIKITAWEKFKETQPGLTDAQLLEQGFVKPQRPRVFCASMADVFDNEVPQEWRSDLFVLIAATPHLDWLLLTKRIGNAIPMLRASIGDSFFPSHENIWLGITVCNQEEVDRDVFKLLKIPAAKRFLSIEPLLGQIDLTNVKSENSGHGHHEFSPIVTMNALQRPHGTLSVDWVICGGESGSKARPMHPMWVYSLQEQCQSAGVPFFFKQWGEWFPVGSEPNEAQRLIFLYGGSNARCYAWPDGESMVWAGKKNAGRLLDGQEWNEVPA